MKGDAAPLSAEELELWHAIKQLSDSALAAVGRSMEDETGVSGADFGILSRLEELGPGSVPQKDLQASLRWDKSRLSHQLTRMEARALLVRKPMKTGRGTLVSLLAEGRRALAAARPVHAAGVRKFLLQHIRPAEAKVILGLRERLREK